MAYPFKKEDTRTKLGYYFDDDRIGIVQVNDQTGEWDSISENVSASDGAMLRVHTRARYPNITGLDQDINIDIGLKYGLHLALIDYVRSRLEEDNGNMEKAAYYYARFTSRIKKFPYRRSGVRSIQPYGLK